MLSLYIKIKKITYINEYWSTFYYLFTKNEFFISKLTYADIKKKIPYFSYYKI